MNQRQKGQVILAILLAVLIVAWLFMAGEEADRIFRWGRLFGLIASAGGVLSMELSCRAEEINKKKAE